MNLLFERRLFPLVLQVLTLVAFLLLVAGGLLADTGDPDFARILRNTNLANLVVWSTWWPLIILAAIFLGRVWCMVCPMELVASLAARVGWRRRSPRLLRSGWGMTLFYVLILFLGIHTLAVHRVPWRMAMYLLVLLGTALVAGLLFARNAFCAHLCPVGHLLGLYSRIAPFGWGVRERDLCRDCRDHACTDPERAYRFLGRSCGVGLHPAAADRSDACLLCGQCVKVCAGAGDAARAGRPNPGWFRRPWCAGLFGSRALTPAQTAFCLVVSGFVVYEVFTEWEPTRELLLWAPTRVEAWLGSGGIWSHGLATSLTLFLALPLLVWLLPWGLYRLLGGALPAGRWCRNLALVFVPVLAAAHACKALVKLSSRVPYWEHALRDPVGLETARNIQDGSLVLAPPPAWRDPLLDVAAPLLLALGLLVSLALLRRFLRREVPEGGIRLGLLHLPVLVYGGAFLTMVVVWRWT